MKTVQFLLVGLFFAVAAGPLLALGNAAPATNLEVSQPLQGTWGLRFTVTNNALGNTFWTDPETDKLTSYALAGVGGLYYLTRDLRVGVSLEGFRNAWKEANNDEKILQGFAIETELAYRFLAAGPIALLAGPVVEMAAAWDSLSASGVSTEGAGQTFSAGAFLEAGYYPHAQFCVAASCPFLYRFVTTTTNSATAVVGPTEASVFAPSSIQLSLIYLF